MNSASLASGRNVSARHASGMPTPYANCGQNVHRSGFLEVPWGSREPRGTPELLNGALERGRKRVVAQRAIERRTAGRETEHVRDDVKGAVAVVSDRAARDDAGDLRAEDRLQLPHPAGQM